MIRPFFLSMQPEALKQLKETYPEGRFWIKADGCDINPALQESVKGLWNGDIDLGDGKLKELRQEYDNRRMLCKAKDLKEDKAFLESKLRQQIDNLAVDIKFLSDGLVAAEAEYQRKFNSPNTFEGLLKTLCWERVEFNTLLQQSQCFKEKYQDMLDCLALQEPRIKDVVTAFRNIEKDSCTYLRSIFVKKRQPAATHILLFLISDERRNKKPFAIPVQYVPYKSIRDQFVRDLTNNIKAEMMKMGLKPVGKSFKNINFVGFQGVDARTN